MSFATNYQLSAFGSFSISPEPETITSLMTTLNQRTQKIFLPSLINSQQIEVPSNKITVLSNVGFITQDQQYNLVVLNERIDINYTRMSEENIDIGEFYCFAVKVLSAIIEYAGVSSNRLAMNLQYVCELDNISDINTKGKALIKAPEYYSNKELLEWSMRMNSQVGIQINDLQETLNVISDLSSAQDVSGKKAAILFHIDINTIPINKNMRFGNDALEPFVKNSIPIAKELINGVERLVLDA